MSPLASTAPSTPGQVPAEISSTDPSTPGMFPEDLKAFRLTRTISGDSTEIDEEECGRLEVHRGVAYQKQVSESHIDAPPNQLEEKEMHVAKPGRKIRDLEEHVFSGLNYTVETPEIKRWLSLSLEDKIGKAVPKGLLTGGLHRRFGPPSAFTKALLVERARDYIPTATWADIKPLFKAKFGYIEEDEEVYDFHGMAWQVVVGRGISETKTRHEEKLDSLDESLKEVKTLFAGKYGYSVDDDSDEEEEDEEEETGRVEIGRGAAYQKQVYERRIDALLSQLEEVKELHVAKYGRSLEDLEEDEEVYDSDGMSWKVIVGKGLTEQKTLYKEKLESLDDGLNEVKVLYEAKFGHAFESDDEEEQGGYIEIGRGAAYQKQVYESRIDALLSQLEEVKEMHVAKCGRTVDDIKEGEDVYDSDGMAWNVVVGRGAIEQKTRYEEKMGGLDESLNEVKTLFVGKYGYSVDDDSEEEETGRVETGRGAAYQKQVYESRIDALLCQLEEVKEMHVAKYGCTVDHIEESGRVETGRGIKYQKQVYNSRIDTLLQQLEEVKQMHIAKYGRTIDDIEENEEVFDKDGTAWKVVVGQGQGQAAAKPAAEEKVDNMSNSLDEVRMLCQGKYGSSVDHESDDEEEHVGKGLAEQKQIDEEELFRGLKYHVETPEIKQWLSLSLEDKAGKAVPKGLLTSFGTHFGPPSTFTKALLVERARDTIPTATWADIKPLFNAKFGYYEEML